MKAGARRRNISTMALPERRRSINYVRAQSTCTSPDDVTLYDLNDYCIRAATMDQKTSLVERLAREEQPPDYFVSQ